MENIKPEFPITAVLNNTFNYISKQMSDILYDLHVVKSPIIPLEKSLFK